jgi:hypothetical protein
MHRDDLMIRISKCSYNEQRLACCAFRYPPVNFDDLLGFRVVVSLANSGL